MSQFGRIKGKSVDTRRVDRGEREVTSVDTSGHTQKVPERPLTKKERKQLEREARRKEKEAKREAKKAKRGRRTTKKERLSDTFLQDIAPFGNLDFRSEYFKTGMYYGTVLTFMAEAGAVSGLPPLWGTMLIPVTEDEEVTARLVVNMQTRSKQWVTELLHQF